MTGTTLRPTTFRFAKWYGYIFSLCYILYGGVKIFLGVQDHDFNDFNISLLFLVIGIVLMLVVLAYRDLKEWGWYGMVGVNVIILIRTLFGLGQVESIVLLLLTAIVLAALLASPTRELVFGRR